MANPWSAPPEYVRVKAWEIHSMGKDSEVVGRVFGHLRVTWTPGRSEDDPTHVCMISIPWIGVK